jgi:hypothetical protein
MTRKEELQQKVISRSHYLLGHFAKKPPKTKIEFECIQEIAESIDLDKRVSIAQLEESLDVLASFYISGGVLKVNR